MFEEDFKNQFGEKPLLDFFNKLNNGVCPELNTAFTKLSYREKLLARPKRIIKDETRKKISESNKGRKKKPMSEEMRVLRNEKVKQTRKNNGTSSGRPKISIVDSNNGIVYNSATECSAAIGICRHTVLKWAKLNKNGLSILK